MWELDCEESWVPKNLCFWTVVLERLLRVPWTARRSNQSILKEIIREYSLERQMLTLKLLILWSPYAKSRLIWKTSDIGKDWRQEEKVTIEDEMVGWHHQLNGHKFGQAQGTDDGQGCLACCNGVAKSWTQLSYWTDSSQWNRLSFFIANRLTVCV